MLLISMMVISLLALGEVTNNYNFGTSELASSLKTFLGMKVSNHPTLVKCIVLNSRRQQEILSYLEVVAAMKLKYSMAILYSNHVHKSEI
jgi:hypothetical protein